MITNGTAQLALYSYAVECSLKFTATAFPAVVSLELAKA